MICRVHGQPRETWQQEVVSPGGIGGRSYKSLDEKEVMNIQLGLLAQHRVVN